jgi:hypothetical protein
MIYIKIPISNIGSVLVYENDKLLFRINRYFSFGFKVTGEVFEKDKKIAVVTNSFLSIKVLFQDIESNIKVLSSYFPFYSKFKVGNNEIKIIDNPLYFISPKIYSKILWNDKLIANVSLKRLIDMEGIELQVKLISEDCSRDAKYYVILIYLMTCININV